MRNFEKSLASGPSIWSTSRPPRFKYESHSANTLALEVPAMIRPRLSNLVKPFNTNGMLDDCSVNGKQNPKKQKNVKISSFQCQGKPLHSKVRMRSESWMIPNTIRRRGL